jgi:hypothetical protein
MLAIQEKRHMCEKNDPVACDPSCTSRAKALGQISGGPIGEEEPVMGYPFVQLATSDINRESRGNAAQFQIIVFSPT